MDPWTLISIYFLCCNTTCRSQTRAWMLQRKDGLITQGGRSQPSTSMGAFLMARAGSDDTLRTPSDRRTSCCITARIVLTGPLNPNFAVQKKPVRRRAAMKISLKTVFEVESCRSSQGTKEQCCFPHHCCFLHCLRKVKPLSSAGKWCTGLWTPSGATPLPLPVPKWGPRVEGAIARPSPQRLSPRLRWARDHRRAAVSAQETSDGVGARVIHLFLEKFFHSEIIHTADHRNTCKHEI